jgi:hypothetical protein
MASFLEAIREFHTLSRTRRSAALEGRQEQRYQALLTYLDGPHDDREPPTHEEAEPTVAAAPEAHVEPPAAVEPEPQPVVAEAAPIPETPAAVTEPEVALVEASQPAPEPISAASEEAEVTEVAAGEEFVEVSEVSESDPVAVAASEPIVSVVEPVAVAASEQLVSVVEPAPLVEPEIAEQVEFTGPIKVEPEISEVVEFTGPVSKDQPALVEAAASTPAVEEAIDVSMADEAPAPLAAAPAESDWVIVEEHAEAAPKVEPAPEALASPEPVENTPTAEELSATQSEPQAPSVMEAEPEAPVAARVEEPAELAASSDPAIDIDVDLAADELLAAIRPRRTSAADWMEPPAGVATRDSGANPAIAAPIEPAATEAIEAAPVEAVASAPTEALAWSEIPEPELSAPATMSTEMAPVEAAEPEHAAMSMAWTEVTETEVTETEVTEIDPALVAEAGVQDAESIGLTAIEEEPAEEVMPVDASAADWATAAGEEPVAAAEPDAAWDAAPTEALVPAWEPAAVEGPAAGWETPAAEEPAAAWGQTASEEPAAWEPVAMDEPVASDASRTQVWASAAVAAEPPTYATDATIQIDAAEVRRILAGASQPKPPLPPVEAVEDDATMIRPPLSLPLEPVAEAPLDHDELVAFATGESNDPGLGQQVSSQLEHAAQSGDGWSVTPATPEWETPASTDWAAPAPTWSAEPEAQTAHWATPAPAWSVPVAAAAAQSWSDAGPADAEQAWASDAAPATDNSWIEPIAEPITEWTPGQATAAADSSWAETAVEPAPAWTPSATTWADQAAPGWSAVPVGESSWAEPSPDGAWANAAPEAAAWQAETTPSWQQADPNAIPLASPSELLSEAALHNGWQPNHQTEPELHAVPTSAWSTPAAAPDVWSDPEAWAAPPPPAAPAELKIGGEHRVVLHTIEGGVKRGVATDIDLLAESLLLAPNLGSAAPEVVPFSKAKAVFFLLQPGEHTPEAVGKRVKVTFVDGRQVEGYLGEEMGRGFFLLPIDPRTNTARVYVLSHAVRSVV